MLGGRFEGDVVAERFELADVVAFLGVGVDAVVVVVGAEAVSYTHLTLPTTPYV